MSIKKSFRGYPHKGSVESCGHSQQKKEGKGFRCLKCGRFKIKKKEGTYFYSSTGRCYRIHQVRKSLGEVQKR